MQIYEKLFKYRNFCLPAAKLFLFPTHYAKPISQSDTHICATRNPAFEYQKIPLTEARGIHYICFIL